jgi:hypothetical protein
MKRRKEERFLGAFPISKESKECACIMPAALEEMNPRFRPGY